MVETSSEQRRWTIPIGIFVLTIGLVLSFAPVSNDTVNPKSLAPVSESTPLVKSILGNYENHLYDDGGKNDWHYVTISQIDDTTLEWRNRAGIAWTLKTTQNKKILDVGRDCPYFSEGHTSVKVVWDGDQVSGLIGPGNELYEKSK